MATGREVEVVTTMSDKKEFRFKVKVWDGVSIFPMEELATIADLKNVNYPIEGEAHIVKEDGCLYVYTKKNPCQDNCEYLWKNCGRVVAEAPWETWARQPENVGKGEREFLNWLKNGKDLPIYTK